jgi:hypothetical protein
LGLDQFLKVLILVNVYSFDIEITNAFQQYISGFILVEFLFAVQALGYIAEHERGVDPVFVFGFG